ncbi:MFS transporter [Loigolactobacillus backii]|uniref:MFS transporter n=1 Tax=Loigolactobacillus backii TaxID=375175 RepID=UPI000C1CC13C|nr:MFS transporter [Loigolactobacillus backii]PIO82317.1 MFS transporter [Loigolactobacillus backii]
MKKHTEWLLLFGTSLVSFMGTLDASVVNIAMPDIAATLHIPMNVVEWVASVYLVTICVLLLFWGKLSDQIGRVNIFQVGTLIFILGSAISGFSSSLIWLLIGRVIQAFGASMTMATNFGIITAIFPKNMQGRAFGLNSLVLQVGNVAGPGVGGIILSYLNWHWIFFINLPIGIAVFVLDWAIFKHETIVWTDISVDWQGFGLYAVMIILFFGMIFYAQVAGFTNPISLLLLAVAIGLLVSFIWTERHVADPIIQLKVFRKANFTIGLISAMLVYIVGYFSNVIMPFYLERTLSMAPKAAGLLLMGIPLANVIAAPIGGYLTDKYGAVLISFFALFIFVIPLVYFQLIQITWAVGLVFIVILFLGIGNGMFQNNPMIMASAPQAYQGVAGSLAALARNIGMTIGLSVATTSLYAGMSMKAGYKLTTYPIGHPAYFMAGMHFSYGLALGLILIAIALVGWVLKTKGPWPV